MAAPPDTPVEVVFKKEYTRLIAILVARYGRQQIESIEDAVQEALLRAVKTWPYGQPDKPAAWLLRVADRCMVDQFRRDQRMPGEALQSERTESGEALPAEAEIRDDQLKMMFACCHPGLGQTDQLLLSLRYLCGLGISEIARVLLKRNDAVEKGLSRAKKRFREQVASFDLPPDAELSARLHGVMRIIYLQFTEGYKPVQGEALVNRALCFDAIKLCEQLLESPRLNTPDVNALLALMYFQSSRFDTRTDEEGNLLTLEHQDRSRWNHMLIRQGLIHFGRSMASSAVSEYHLQAAIASCHSTAASFGETPWKDILITYEALVQLTDNPIHRLNRIVALWKARGAGEALREMDAQRTLLPGNYTQHLLEAELWLAEGEEALAAESLERALALARNRVERNYIQGKLRTAKGEENKKTSGL